MVSYNWKQHKISQGQYQNDLKGLLFDNQTPDMPVQDPLCKNPLTNHIANMELFWWSVLYNFSGQLHRLKGLTSLMFNELKTKCRFTRRHHHRRLSMASK